MIKPFSLYQTRKVLSENCTGIPHFLHVFYREQFHWQILQLLFTRLHLRLPNTLSQFLLLLTNTWYLTCKINESCYLSFRFASLLSHTTGITNELFFGHFIYSLCSPLSRRKLECILCRTNFHKINYGYNSSFTFLKLKLYINLFNTYM